MAAENGKERPQDAFGQFVEEWKRLTATAFTRTKSQVLQNSSQVLPTPGSQSKAQAKQDIVNLTIKGDQNDDKQNVPRVPVFGTAEYTENGEVVLRDSDTARDFDTACDPEC